MIESRVMTEKEKYHFIFCHNCFGEGKIKKKKKKHHEICSTCNGSGLVKSNNSPIADTENFPHLAIIGGGIGGVALAVACLHRKIPFTLYEKDKSFDARSQGYGLTLQQASRIIKSLGIESLTDTIISTKHIVHNTDGTIIGEWGMRKWLDEFNSDKKSKRTNIHIARQALRLQLLKQLDENNNVKWNYQLINFKQNKDEIELTFEVDDIIKHTKTQLLIGADGIRSSVRKILITDEQNSLQYLGCIVILGICSLSALNNLESDLLDSKTVFQTANGNERMYVMPYSTDKIMWQFSFPMSEDDAKLLSSQGSKALKDEVIKRTKWHSPIPKIVASTLENAISGYPVYDRQLLDLNLTKDWGNVTLIGDAAHPMSPFKGQGANQALLDSLALARAITKNCKRLSNFKNINLRKEILNNFENEMIERVAPKVKASSEAVKILHSEIVLQEGNQTRGSFS